MFDGTKVIISEINSRGTRTVREEATVQGGTDPPVVPRRKTVTGRGGGRGWREGTIFFSEKSITIPERKYSAGK